MSDYGHFHAMNGNGCFIDAWGAGPFIMRVAGKEFRFEDSDQFGPWPLRKDDDPMSRPFGRRSPFWPAWKLWKEQGRKVGPDSMTAVWWDPKTGDGDDGCQP